MGGMAAQERLPATGLEEDKPPQRRQDPSAAEQGEHDFGRKRRREDHDEGEGRSAKKASKEHKHKKSKEHKEHNRKKSKKHKHEKSKDHKHRR